MMIENSYNFRRVSSLLTTSGVVGAMRLRKLSSEGYQAVINLLPDDSKSAVEDERQIVERQGLKYIHIPVDFDNPCLNDYEQFASALDAVSETKAHIHCAANYRVSVFYSLYAQSRGIWSSSQAQSFISSLWQPLESPGWPEFINQVSEQYLGE